MLERWKSIKGFEEYYMISDAGRVKSLHTYNGRKPTIRKNGERICTSGLSYPCINFYVKGKARGHYIHRLVAEAFIPNPNNLPLVNHIDSNPSNSHYTNLEWCTQSQNVLHAFNTGRRPRGTKPKNTKLTLTQAINIKHCKGSIHRTKLAELYHVSESTIRAIWTRRHWKEIQEC